MIELPSVSVVIATHNRKIDVLRAIESCIAQDYPALEVLVYDDASTDGTQDAVLAGCPRVRFTRTHRNVGYIVLRNRGFKEANGKYVFSLDDDAYFTYPNTTAQTVELLEADEKAAAVAIPFVEPRNPRGGFQETHSAGTRVRGYVGCAHAIRRDVALELGGYREFFFHQGEERDLGIRMLDRGHEIVYGSGGPIVHLYSPVRNQGRMNYYGVRNTLLFDYLNVPHPYLLPALVRHAVKLFFYRLRPGNVLHRLGYVVGGLAACVKYAGHRRPVARSTYRRYLSLPSHGPLAVTEDAAQSF